MIFRGGIKIFLLLYFCCLVLPLRLGPTCHIVNTKNWYREETDMWAEFDRIAPFGRRFSSKHSVEASAVGSAPSFGRRTDPRVKAESIR
jgi:hypothetical protein